MLLSKEDITRLEKKGYRKKFFARFDKAGYAKLRNHQGYCVFYNVEKCRCNAYRARPSGCRLYPVICDEDNNIIADTLCQAHETVTEQDKRRRGKRVHALLEKIDQEAQRRRS
jgi:hypothetical protein